MIKFDKYFNKHREKKSIFNFFENFFQLYRRKKLFLEKMPYKIYIKF